MDAMVDVRGILRGAFSVRREMEVTNVAQLTASVPIHAPVAVRLNNNVKEEYKDLEDQTLLGWWLGVHPNEDVSPVLRQDDNGWHWVAHVADAYVDDKIYVIHLAIIEEVNIAQVTDVRE